MHNPMKRLALALASALIGLSLPSCLQSETTISLNKDGSGTIVEETTFGAQMVAMIGQMAALGAPGDDPLSNLSSEEKATTRATELGEGVTFSKAVAVTKRDGAKGARVTYEFKDINTVRFAAGDSVKSAFPDAGGAALDAVENAPPLKFSYADGKLVITLPQPEKEAAGEELAEIPATDEEANPEMEAMMKQMLGDMKVALRVVVEPGISATNATHRVGNTITLMEMDMGQLLKEEGTLKKLSALDQSDPAASLEAIKNIPGVKMETQEKVEITLD